MQTKSKASSITLRSCLIRERTDQNGQPKTHVAIAGKTMRRSHDRRNNLGVLHIVSAWATEQGISLGQIATEEKSNEITAIPELLESMGIIDTIISIDAAVARRTSPLKSLTMTATTSWH